MKNVWIATAVAAVLWFAMFCPWTASVVPFWWTMAGAGIILTSLSFWLGGNPLKNAECRMQNAAFLGLLIAAALWSFFWVGNIVSQWMFSFAGAQINGIYGMKADTPEWIIALLLLFVIGPAEELFWRGFVQRKMSLRWGRWAGFAVATLCYTAVHIWSGNFMLLVAAAACGFCWGLLYCLFPRQLPALIVSHALWDVAAFVVFPF